MVWGEQRLKKPFNWIRTTPALCLDRTGQPMVFVLGLSLAAQGGECPDRDALLTQGQTALVQGQLTEAQLALEAFHLTFDCETPVSSEDLGRFALLQGAIYFLTTS